MCDSVNRASGNYEDLRRDYERQLARFKELEQKKSDLRTCIDELTNKIKQLEYRLKEVTFNCDVVQISAYIAKINEIEYEVLSKENDLHNVDCMCESIHYKLDYLRSRLGIVDDINLQSTQDVIDDLINKLLGK